MSASDDDEKQMNSFAFAVADVNAQLPGPRNEIATVFKFDIAWVRDALAAVDIKVDNLTEPGECKAALITFHQGRNTAECQENKEVDAPKAALAILIRAKEATATTSPLAVSSSHAFRAKGALLKNVPSPHKTAGLNWKATSTTNLGFDGRQLGVVDGLDRQGMARPARHVPLAHRRARRGLR